MKKNILMLACTLTTTISAFAQADSQAIVCQVKNGDGSVELSLNPGQCADIGQFLSKPVKEQIKLAQQTFDSKKKECETLRFYQLAATKECAQRLDELQSDARYLTSKYSNSKFSLCARDMKYTFDRPEVAILSRVETDYSSITEVLERYSILPQTAGLDVGVKLTSHKSNDTYDAKGGELPNYIPLDQADFTLSCK